MKSSAIKTRFIVDLYDHQGKPFFYTTDITEVMSLGIPHNAQWHTSNVMIGTVLNISGRKYVVKDVMLCVLDETDEIDENIGINVYGYGDNHPFNFEVRLYVLPA